MENIELLEKCSKHYDFRNLQVKISRFYRLAGMKVIYKVLLLKELLLKSAVSEKDKTIIQGALGYFICPLDVIPDILAGTGFLDDATVLTMALTMTATSVTSQMKTSVKSQFQELFGIDRQN